MKDMWNNRFGKEEYVYGTQPNRFLAEELEKLQKGRILFIGEGEGRNSVFAAKLGWEVDAVDYSEEGRKKALKLAGENGVSIDYRLADLNDFIPSEGNYDAVVSIYIHLPEELRKRVHGRLISALKRGGTLILEAFDKEQLKYNSGGPKDESLLYSLEDVVEDFIELDFERFEKVITNLNEGAGHEGEGAVIRLVGKKK